MAYNSRECDIAFRTGCVGTGDRILGFLSQEIDAYMVAANDSSRTPTDRTLQRCFAEITGMLKEKIEAMLREEIEALKLYED